MKGPGYRRDGAPSVQEQEIRNDSCCHLPPGRRDGEECS